MSKSNTDGIIESFFEYNKKQSAQFTAPSQTLWRRQYRSKNPIEMAATKCMDGRINLSLITGIPVGIIQSYHNLGGKLDVGGHFGEVLSEWVGRAIANGKDCMIFVTYHWSKGLRERGCKGFNCDVDAAREYTHSAVTEIEEVFGKDHMIVYPIQVGIETDQDALIFHGAAGKILDLSKVKSANPAGLRVSLERLFPDMKRSMVDNLVSLCIGNMQHIQTVKKSKRPIKDVEHKENVLAVGRGFDWFHQHNRMLIVGPYSFNLAEPIAVAGKILLDNIKSGRIPKKEGCILIASAVYREFGPEQARAILKARSLLKFAKQTLAQEVPELLDYMRFSTGILNEHSHLFSAVSND